MFDPDVVTTTATGPAEIGRRNAHAEDRVFSAMASRVRRRMLDLLRKRPMNTGEIAEKFPALSRFAVMQHLKVLARARLIVVEKRGRKRVNHLNIVPIQQTLFRWVQPGESSWADALVQLKSDSESPQKEGPGLP